MSNDKTIFRTLVSASTSDEVNDFDIAIKYGADDDSKYDFNIKDRRVSKDLRAYFEHEVCPISISEMEKMISDAKNTGATHVGVFFHGDHREYEVYGYTYEQITPKEIEELDKSDLQKDEDTKKEALRKLIQEATRLGVKIV